MHHRGHIGLLPPRHADSGAGECTQELVVARWVAPFPLHVSVVVVLCVSSFWWWPWSQWWLAPVDCHTDCNYCHDSHSYELEL
jgi:hypothetical protein